MKYIYLIVLLVTSSQIAEAQTGSWKLTGPIQFPTNNSGQVNGMGRVSQIVFHPTDPNKMYAASASGGVYISTDGANSWKVTGTDNLPSMECASLCVDYTNDSILYLGSGDANYYSPSLGIWKSINGGATWHQSNSGIGNRMALDILMDPSNNKILIAATNDGIWKSANAGATWTETFVGGDFKMMKFNAVNSNIIYAVTSTTFYRSADMGSTWTSIAMPTANTGGGRIGVSKADANRVYVTFVGDFSNNIATPVYKSTDGGLTFTIVKPANTYNLNGYDETQGGQGDYNYGMTVDPLDANNVWVCGHCVFRSTDGGVTWSRKTDWAIQMHTDMHQIVYALHNSTRIFNANDGGVWKNTDAGAGVAWTPNSNGLSSTECYHAGQSPIKKDRMGAGTQDNGELYYDVNTWHTNRGGDWGSLTAFDYQNTDWIYYADNGQRRIGLTGASQNMSFPFTASSATLIEFTALSINSGFLAETDVYRTDNLSSNPPKWNKLSNINEVIKAIAVSPADANVVYAITVSGKVFRSDNALNAAATFSNVSRTPTAPSSKASIAVIKSSSNVVYISCNSKVYRSADKGVTWINISTGLPATNFLKILHDTYSNDESIYIANGVSAVYYKNNTLSSWVNYSQGLPTVAPASNDFMIYNDGNYANSVLRISFYGRGIWESGLYTAQAPAPNFTVSNVGACGGKVQFTDLSLNGPTSWLWDFGDGQTSTLQNPLHNYASSGTYTIKLTVRNAFGLNQAVKTNFVQVQILSAPTATGAARCDTGLVTLLASGQSGNILNWYSAPTGGNYLASGASYSPGLTATTTFYVEQSNAGNLQAVGPQDSSLHGGGFYNVGKFTSHGLVFDALVALNIKTVKVYSDSAYTRLIQVLDTIGGNVVVTKSVAIPVGMSIITLDFRLPAKNNYFMKIMGTNANMHLYRNSNGPYSYPYQINGLISIKQSDINASPTKYYYYFYDWNVQTDGCEGPRTAATGTIYTSPPKPTITDISGTLTANPSGSNYQWYLGGTAIGGATNQNYTPLRTGNYTVETTDRNGCTALSTIFPYTITGINLLSDAEVFHIFPNPANNVLTIDLNFQTKCDITIYLINIIGEEILSQNFKNSGPGKFSTAFDLQNLSPGTYFVKIYLNNKINVQKLIISK
jgi:PKD repeat protein/photosystem II stability/assembly factor-like uncharacterized protein